jgi:maltooligosyltrehalose trehalohydrolase
MGWDPAVVPDPQDVDTFTRSKLDWAELATDDHARMLDLYRALAVLRRTVPELTDPRFAELSATYDDDARWFRLNRGPLVILANLGADELTVELGGNARALLATDAGTTLAGGKATLPGHSALIARIT